MGPPRAKFLEPDVPVTVGVDGQEGSVNLGVAIADAQRIEELGHLRLRDTAVSVGVDSIEAVAQRVQAHAGSLRRLRRGSKCAVMWLSLALGACHERRPAPPAIDSSQPPRPPLVVAGAKQPVLPLASTSYAAGLSPLQGEWLTWLGEGQDTVVVMPPLGTTEPVRLVIAAHGAGDRPDWACGGWRLGSKVSAVLACPQGSKLGTRTFAWPSPQVLEKRVLAALEIAKARYGEYLQPAPFIYAGFSQGATYAEALLTRHASTFPIAILAEGAYRTTENPAFAATYRATGGKRVVLVCGGHACFVSARGAQRVLERAGLEVLVVGDEKAGHNLNGEMQRALQRAWPEITAPLP